MPSAFCKFCVLLLAIQSAGCATVFEHVVNPPVVEELRSEPHGSRAHRTMLLTLPDGRAIPVDYVRQGDRLYAVSGFRWWRTLRGGKRVTVFIRGERLTGVGDVFQGDAAVETNMLSRLKMPVLGIPPAWTGGALVEIVLDSNAEMQSESTSRS